MGRPLTLLNVSLGLVALLITGALVKTWIAPEPEASSARAVKSSQELAAVSFSRSARPPATQFDVLVERNPFKQPPPQLQRPPHPGAPPPPPVPLPALIGTIIVDDERRAVLADKGKSDIYVIGQEVAGGTLTAISEDRALFKRGDVVSELTLKSPIQPAGAPPKGPAGQPAPQPVSAPPPPVPPHVIEGAPVSQGTPSSREERRRLQRLRQEERRRQNLEGGG